MTVVLTTFISLHLTHEFEDSSHPPLHLVHTGTVWMVILGTRASSAFTIDPIQGAINAVCRRRASSRTTRSVAQRCLCPASRPVYRLIPRILIAAETTASSWGTTSLAAIVRVIGAVRGRVGCIWFLGGIW